MPEWLELVSNDRTSHPETITGYQSGPVWEMYHRKDPSLVRVAEQATQTITLRAEVYDPPDLDYFRDTIGVVTYLLDCGGVAVSDMQQLKLWSVDEWRQTVFAPNKPVPRQHVVILTSPEENDPELLWFHTRGLRQYGRPDLSVRRVGTAYREAITHLLDRLIELHAYGGVIEEEQEVRMHDLPPGGVCQHAGELDDPDFNNIHVEIVWPGDVLAES
jgi:hypothetical protein